MTAPMSSSRIEEHPDLLALRAESEQRALTPVAQGVEGLQLLAAIYLCASPWIAGFFGQRAITANDLITGGALILLTMAFGHAYERTHALSWAALGVGIWTIISPWTTSTTSATTRVVASNVAVGTAIVLLACAMAAIGAGNRRMARASHVSPETTR